MPVRAFIGLGSNLDEPQEQLQKALAAIKDITATRLLRVSGLYVTRPMGPADQADYLNAVAELETELQAPDLLEALQAIERHQGRRRDGVRWHERPLDLDILLFGNQSINTDNLVVPHPGMHTRAFVLYPLQELDADISIPGKGHIKALLHKDLLGEVVQRLDENLCP
jgi:2-amino-4-hydroxy-6-hydroxymethyldihydropteridine diphosphokinase